MLCVMRLQTYLKDNSITAEKFAEMLGTSASGVRKWVYGDRKPRPDMILKIQEVTAGAVTFNDLVGSTQAPANEDDEVSE